MVRFPIDECIVLEEKFNFEKIVRRKIADDSDDDPVFICDVADILLKYKTWKECFPRITPFYGTIEVQNE